MHPTGSVDLGQLEGKRRWAVSRYDEENPVVVVVDRTTRNTSRPVSRPARPLEQPSCEYRMPPEMWKKWIHRELEVLREANARECLDVEMDIDSAFHFV